MSDLRLALGPAGTGDASLDGGWWPRSRDLATEVAHLVDRFPADRGRIVEGFYSAADWEDAPRRIVVRGRSVRVERLSSDDPHVIYLATSHKTMSRLLVIPPAFDDDQGTEALLAAATTGNHHSAADLLDVITNELPVDPFGRWAPAGDK